MLNNTKASTPGLGQVYGQGLGLDNYRSNGSVLFSQSNSSESTVGDSMFSGGSSILCSVGGRSSILGYNSTGYVRRTSIA